MRTLRSIFIACLLLLLFVSTTHTQWIQTNGPFGGGTDYITDLAISDTNLFAGTGGGVFLSSNNGVSWSKVNTGLYDTSVSSLAVIPNGTGGNNLYAGTGSGVFLSTNNGVNWTEVNSGLTNKKISSLTVSSRGVGEMNLFAGTYNGGVFISTNNGTSWAAVDSGLTNNSVYSLAVNNTNIFAGTTGGNVFFTDNNGSSWTVVDSGITTTNNVLSLAVKTNGSSGTSLFAGTWGGGIFQSSNNGASWKNIFQDSGLAYTDVYSIAVTGENVFAGTAHGVFLSTDNGLSWAAVNLGLPAEVGVSSLHFNRDGTLLFAGIADGYGVWQRPVYEMIPVPTGRAIVDIGSRWNLISVPVYVTNDTVSNLFPNHGSKAFAYDGIGYQINNQMKSGTGYWIKFASTTIDTISGGPVSFSSIAVTNGWNLIGSLSSPLTASSITSYPPGMITSNFFDYDGNYKISDTIIPGKGYWVKVNQAGTLILSTETTASLAKNANTSHIKIISTNELPPPPPSEDGASVDLPKEFTLEQNYPNPFNPTTTLKYSLPTESQVTLKIYNVLGQSIATVLHGVETAGYKEIEWNASDFSSGLYFYKLEATSVTDPGQIFTQVRKMVLLK